MKMIVVVVALIGNVAFAEDTIRIEVKLFDAPASVEVSKADVDSGTVFKNKSVSLFSAPRVTTFHGQEAGMQVMGVDPATGLQTGMTLNVKPEVLEGKIKFFTRANSLKVENGAKSVGWFEVSGACESGESMLYSSRNARTGRIEYFYVMMVNESAAKK